MSGRALTDAESVRFGRNVLLPEIGLGGQETLRSATVRLTELGAVGSAAALYLGAAGIGRLVIDDARPVTAADLAGTLYRAADVGTPRTSAARRALQALDPDLVVTSAPEASTGSEGGVEGSAVFDPDLVVTAAPEASTGSEGGVEGSVDFDPPPLPPSLWRSGEVTIDARDIDQDRATLTVSPSTITVLTVTGGPGPRALLAGALAAAEAVKALLGLGAPIRAEALP